MAHKVTKYLLLVAALTPLVYTPAAIFPFTTGKLAFFRILIEVTAVLFLWLLAASAEIRAKLAAAFKNPIVVLTILFISSAVLSSLLADNVYLAFWGNLERGEGLFTLLHFLAFFIMAAVVFIRKDWQSFIKLSLVVSLIVIFYSILQWLGIENFPGAFESRKRPLAFMGNSSFLASYLILIIGFSYWLFKEVQGKFWRWLAAATAGLAIFIVFLTATRGALLALLVGALFLVVYNWRKILQNKAILSVVILLAILISIFGFTKNHSFWQSVPGLDRLAQLSLDHPTVQTRLIALGASWEAFKERPLLGWGIDNFGIAYNKHYNPDYALYEAAWFDRAHNKLADVAVMQGLVGLIVYLSLLGSIIWLLYKKGQLPLLALLVIYFTQNLFVFDTLSSYLLFFSFLGLAVNLTTNHSERSNEFNEGRNILPGAAAILLIPVVGYSVYVINFTPYQQTRQYWYARHNIAEVNELLRAADEFLTPYNFAQSTIRKEFHDYLVGQEVFEKTEPAFAALGDKGLRALEEYVEREPTDPRNLIRLSEAYNDRAETAPSYFEKSEAVLRQALELAPKRQEIYYHLAYTLVGAGKNKEALAVAQAAVDLQPEVARAHYMQGVILTLTGQRAAGEAKIEQALEMKRGLFFLGADDQNIIQIYGGNFIRYARQRDLAGMERTAERLGQFQPELAEPLNKLLELARQGRWGELNVALDLISNY